MAEWTNDEILPDEPEWLSHVPPGEPISLTQDGFDDALVESLKERSEAEEITDKQFDEARAAVFGAAIAPLYTGYNADDYKQAAADWNSSYAEALTHLGLKAAGYRTARTDNPPMLSVKDGALIVSVTHEGLTLEASVGDGRLFFAQVVEMLVEPALLARQTTHDFARAYMKTHGIVSEND